MAGVRPALVGTVQYIVQASDASSTLACYFKLSVLRHPNRGQFAVARAIGTPDNSSIAQRASLISLVLFLSQAKDAIESQSRIVEANPTNRSLGVRRISTGLP